MSAPVNLYDNVYGDYSSSAESAVRRATYGEDIGQSSWMTAAEWLRFAGRIEARADSHVLEVGSGSGGPAVYLATAIGCRVTGVDINEHGVVNARQVAGARGLGDRVAFQQVDASRPLPFPGETFDGVLSNDAMCHIANRAAVLADWYRVLKPGGRFLFTDPFVVTGILSNDEMAARSSIGFYLFVPPGENERLITSAGFELLEQEDLTQEEAAVALRWHDARAAHREELVQREGVVNFDGLQRFLMTAHRLADERRLSRIAYVGERRG